MTATDNSTEIRDQILDAADECIARYGVPKTTIDDIVERAGVARATLYRYVPGGRDEIILECLLREARRNIDVVIDAVSGSGTLEDRLTNGIVAAVDRIRGDEHLSYLFSPEMIGHTSKLDGAFSAMVGVSADVIAPVLAAGRDAGVVADDLTDSDAAEWTIRVITSLLILEGEPDRTGAEQREFIRRFAVSPLLTIS